ncbi:MAG: endonuclease/exonuclease/phosphatase family protein [Rickettsiales bacterium]|jgi:exodeoxyribonuclease-3|nr:endonuclease/exonuclease/phosphatase family protein [Rickettsiales bacterium]
MLRIATWNVNSIRARLENLISWTNSYRPDVLLLQEIKCTEQQFPFSELSELGYNIEILGQKARNGVAILSKFPIYGTSHGLLPGESHPLDSDSRYIEAKFDYRNMVIGVASIYAPNGGPSVADMRSGIVDPRATENFSRKLDFFDKLSTKLKNSVTSDEITFFGGDYNVCPNLQMDVYSTKKDGSITCTEEEREKFRLLLETGVSDLWRKLNPELREYSWWGYRPYYMWEKNLGFRLDAILASPRATALTSRCRIYSKETRGKERASDHTPMMCEIEP